eukprot:CAMPEP_0173396144 /NCGR_PEP_ID=MMETSP1356-20130122/34670_1 /TAXON_ID=77927 ORGANISM="Hemiselmis virescens, Strain PCC157" /NCGR_SAMPLE_ID=MMETSP1356 /ASSEMBLY_ACC=CAM_ASM_000847 /LENGTH=63 /DNA_ID=CAMNT_0014355091 /DNA_START=113 /DNA_END=301 /DNA_ORIENTATION=+
MRITIVLLLRCNTVLCCCIVLVVRPCVIVTALAHRAPAVVPPDAFAERWDAAEGVRGAELLEG